jgi:hypothetical protein
MVIVKLVSYMVIVMLVRNWFPFPFFCLVLLINHAIGLLRCNVLLNLKGLLPMPRNAREGMCIFLFKSMTRSKKSILFWNFFDILKYNLITNFLSLQYSVVYCFLSCLQYNLLS